MSSLYVSNESEEVIGKLSKVINTNRSGVVKIAVQELAHRYLNLPPGMIVIPKEMWDEFWGKLRDEIKKENTKKLERLIGEFEKGMKEGIGREERVTDSIVEAFKIVKDIKIVDEETLETMKNLGREMGQRASELVAITLPPEVFEKIKEVTAATLPLGERLKEIGEEQAKIVGKFAEKLKDLDLGIK